MGLCVRTFTSSPPPTNHHPTTTRIAGTKDDVFNELFDARLTASSVHKNPSLYSPKRGSSLAAPATTSV